MEEGSCGERDSRKAGGGHPHQEEETTMRVGKGGRREGGWIRPRAGLVGARGTWTWVAYACMSSVLSVWECTHNPHARCNLKATFDDCSTSKTLEGRSATYRVQGSGFVFSFSFFDFFVVFSFLIFFKKCSDGFFFIFHFLLKNPHLLSDNDRQCVMYMRTQSLSVPHQV